LTGYLSSHQQLRTKRRQTGLARSGALDAHLDRLFSPKQKELVLKKRDGIALTKTEREYFSRIVRKKLAAIASEEVGQIARNLIFKAGKS